MTKPTRTLAFRFTNADLVKVNDGFVLIDTCGASKSAGIGASS